MMTESFELSEFMDLLTLLATTRGPSLGEAPRRTCLQDYLLNHQITTSVDRAGNLWVRYGQGKWEDSVVFDAHMDVVQEGYTSTINCDEDLITGMGVADNLTAVSLLAMYAVYLEKLRPSFSRPLYFLFSTGEEGSGNLKGVRQAVSDNITPPYAFVSFDLSFDEYAVEGLGSVRYRANITCPGGHSWGDYGIPGAIDQMMGLLMSLKEDAHKLASHDQGLLSFNIGTFEGGEGINSIARNAVATFEFRTPDPVMLDNVDGKVAQAIKKLNIAGSCDAVCELTSRRPAAQSVFRERLEPQVVRILESIGEKASPVIRSTNINATLDAGWPSICMGLCTGGRFHTHQEFVRIDSIEKGWRVLKHLSSALLGVAMP